MPLKDPEARRAYHRGWKAGNRGRYKAQTRLYDQAKHANDRAAAYGAPGVISTEDVTAVLAAGSCHYCGAPEGVPPFGLTLDHVIALCSGGPNDRANLVACCHSCNASKWLGDLPGRWSRKHSECQRCGTADRPHTARGFCELCYVRTFIAPKRKARRAAAA